MGSYRSVGGIADESRDSGALRLLAREVAASNFVRTPPWSGESYTHRKKTPWEMPLC